MLASPNTVHFGVEPDRAKDSSPRRKPWVGGEYDEPRRGGRDWATASYAPPGLIVFARIPTACADGFRRGLQSVAPAELATGLSLVRGFTGTVSYSEATALLERVKELWPPMNADERGLKTRFLSAFIGVHRRPN